MELSEELYLHSETSIFREHKLSSGIYMHEIKMSGMYITTSDPAWSLLNITRSMYLKRKCLPFSHLDAIIYESTTVI